MSSAEGVRPWSAIGDQALDDLEVCRLVQEVGHRTGHASPPLVSIRRRSNPAFARQRNENPAKPQGKACKSWKKGRTVRRRCVSDAHVAREDVDGITQSFEGAAAARVERP